MRITESIYIVGGASFGLGHKFDCNVYLVDFKNELIMIDAGAGVNIDLLIENIKKDHVDPKKISKIFLTHSHADHAGGAYEFHRRFNCDIYISDIGADFVEKGGERELALDIAKKSGLYSKDYKFTNCNVNRRLKHGEIIKVGKNEIKVINIPGHSKGSNCYLLNMPEAKIIFSGDTVFIDGLILVLNCDDSNLSDYRKYINRLANLNVNMLFPGHGLFVLKEGQKHLNMSIEYLSSLFVPKNYV